MTIVNGQLADANEVRQALFNAKWSNSIYLGEGNLLGYGNLFFSETTFVTLGGTNSKRTTDGGATWVNCSTDTNYMSYGTLCEADHTKAIAWVNNTKVSRTTDSGDNWTASTTTLSDTVTCASYKTTGLIVVGVNKSSGARGIWFSTDGGDNFTLCTSGPAAVVCCVDMFDGTTGYAIDDAGNIWKTTNGAVDWTDTTYNVPDSSAQPYQIRIRALSATTILFLSAYQRTIVYITGSGATQTYLAEGYTAAVSNGTMQPFNIIQLTNGCYLLGCLFATTTRYGGCLYLIGSLTAPCPVKHMMLDTDAAHGMNGASRGANTPTDMSLTEYSANKVFVSAIGQGWMKIDLNDVSWSLT